MAHLTIRNLSSTAITVTSIATFPIAEPPAPHPITAKNFTNFANLAHHITTVLRVSGIAPRPTTHHIAESAKGFETSETSVDVPPFRTVETDIAVPARHVLRLVFTVGAPATPEGKFRADLTPAGTTIHALTPDSPHRFTGVYHSSHTHLALLSTASLNGWQARLPDSTPLTSISIPGTHNSPTCHRALPSVRCQAVSIPTQLQNGIRFLDIRCQVESNNSLTLVHGAFPIVFPPTSKTLDELLSDVYGFLDANPGETVILSLKREGRGNADDQAFARALRDGYITPSADRWHLEATPPKLGQVRGKCILFRRFKTVSEWPVGINAEDWTYNSSDTTTPGGTCRVQDFCEVLEAPSIQKKIGYVKEHLERAAVEGAAGGRLWVNFLSGSNFWRVGCWPEEVARRVNVEVRRHLAVEHLAGRTAGDGATGVVVCDYVGERGEWDLVRLVVAMNAWIEKST